MLSITGVSTALDFVTGNGKFIMNVATKDFSIPIEISPQTYQVLGVLFQKIQETATMRSSQNVGSFDSTFQTSDVVPINRATQNPETRVSNMEELRSRASQVQARSEKASSLRSGPSSLIDQRLMAFEERVDEVLRVNANARGIDLKHLSQEDIEQLRNETRIWLSHKETNPTAVREGSPYDNSVDKSGLFLDEDGVPSV